MAQGSGRRAHELVRTNWGTCETDVNRRNLILRYWEKKKAKVPYVIYDDPVGV
jgi:hypothetical protein